MQQRNAHHSTCFRKSRFIQKPGKDEKDIISSFWEKTSSSINEDIHHKIDRLIYNKSKSIPTQSNKHTPNIKTSTEDEEELIIHLSHDLRNSMNPLINLLPVLITSHNQENQDKIITIIKKNMTQIQNLVQHAIQLAQLKSAKTTYSPDLIDLSKEIKNTIEANLAQIEKKQLRIIQHLNKNMHISADLPDIKTVLDQLLKNAILYTNPGDAISINIEKNNEFIHLQINDTGIGMTQDQIQQVFDEYYKADPSRHNLTCHGLGLSICKHIIEKHNGSIWIESKGLHKGSTVHITFPIISSDTLLFD